MAGARSLWRATGMTDDDFGKPIGAIAHTVLHLHAVAREAELDFSVTDIDAMSRQVPCLSKVAPNSQKYHMEDVHRAGGIPTLLGELKPWVPGWTTGTFVAASRPRRRSSFSTRRPEACGPPSDGAYRRVPD